MISNYAMDFNWMNTTINIKECIFITVLYYLISLESFDLVDPFQKYLLFFMLVLIVKLLIFYDIL